MKTNAVLESAASSLPLESLWSLRQVRHSSNALSIHSEHRSHPWMIRWLPTLGD